MSRLRFPFRSQQSSSQITPIVVPAAPKDPNAEYWREVDTPGLGTDKGKAKEAERLWGLENFGNTCYCNSVLQALYACHPFREFVESYPDVPPPIFPLAPPPGTANQPITPSPAIQSGSMSPLVTTKGNPFDNPALTSNLTQPPTTPGVNGEKTKEKRSWSSLGRRPTATGAGPPSLAAIQQGKPQTAPPPTPPAVQSPSLEVPPVPSNPNQPPPSVFETVQTLFQHLSSSAPHQPLPAKKAVNSDAENAQTASLLPSGPAAAAANPTQSLTTTSNPNGPPPGPPLLASLPPPSAPRGGGPFSAGSLGRGVVRPEDLLKTVKRENEMFRGMSQQDAHEFLGWVLNKVAEDVEVVDRSMRTAGIEAAPSKGLGKTFVQNLFEGTLTNETRCLTCEMTSSRDELFLDLSIDIEQHTSVTACLRQFSASEMLCQKNKFYCDSCCGLQEAEKRMKIKRLPNVLALHLKRFKYQENLGRYTKLFYRVPFPTQLRLPNTSDETENPDRLYELFSVVVHIGNGPHHGHYVCLIRSGGRWVMCDDENVEPIDESDVYRYFGDYPSGAGYVLFYQAVDLDLKSLGLKRPPTPPAPTPPASSVPHENLMDIVESYEDDPTPIAKSLPSRIGIPASGDIIAPVEASPVSPIAAASPMATPLRERTQSIASSAGRSERNGVSSPTVERQPSLSAATPSISPGLDNEKDGKWYSRKKSADKASPGFLATSPPTARTMSSNILTTPTKAPLGRHSTSQAIHTASPPAFGNTTLGGLGTSVSGKMPNEGADGMTGAPIAPRSTSDKQMGLTASPPAQPNPTIPNASASPASPSFNPNPQPGTPAPASTPAPAPAPVPGSLGRKPSQSTRDRTVSNSSQSSMPGEKEREKGSLSRRLSGMSVGKIGRSGSMSFGKFGLGRKDKDKGGMEGVDEEREKTVRKGSMA